MCQAGTLPHEAMSPARSQPLSKEDCESAVPDGSHTSGVLPRMSPKGRERYWGWVEGSALSVTSSPSLHFQMPPR